MKIAYTTTFDARDVNNWSGTPYHMAKALENPSTTVHYIGNLTPQLPFGFKTKQFLKKMTGQRESPRFNQFAARAYSKQTAEQLTSIRPDIIVSPRINPIAYLDCRQPIILWTDALYASLVAFYPQFRHHASSTVQAGNAITQACLDRCHLAIFSSDWAARSALEIYGTPREKVQVIPFGANLSTYPNLVDIHAIISKRPRDRVRLLFIGKHWHRKGGDIVFRVAKYLHENGQPVELHLVGCHPPTGTDIPPYIHCHGFISKRTPSGIQKITGLLRASHFLFVPSRAEAFGIVFCEANAYGLPALSSYVGGIATVIHNDINGMTFPLEASPARYAAYIQALMQDYSRYKHLALSSYNEFVTRLNWRTATDTLRRMIQAV